LSTYRRACKASKTENFVAPIHFSLHPTPRQQQQQQQVETNKIFNHQNPHMQHHSKITNSNPSSHATNLVCRIWSKNQQHSHEPAAVSLTNITSYNKQASTNQTTCKGTPKYNHFCLHSVQSLYKYHSISKVSHQHIKHYTNSKNSFINHSFSCFKNFGVSSKFLAGEFVVVAVPRVRC
jgi:hypothetical protein